MEDCGQGPDRHVEEEGIRETVLHGLRSEGRAHSGHDVHLQSRCFICFVSIGSEGGFACWQDCGVLPLWLPWLR